MALGYPIQIRLNPEKKLLYEAEASRRNLPLGTYLRECLEKDNDLLEVISSLRRAISIVVESAQSQTINTTFSPIDPSLQIELLLLLRSFVNPAKLQVVHGELKRLGFTIWNGDPEEGRV